MARVEFQEVYVPDRDPERIAGFALEDPSTDIGHDATAVKVKGWVLGWPVPAVAVEILDKGAALARMPVNYWRLDIVEAYPEVPGAERSGFLGYVDFSGLGARSELQLVAVLTDGARVVLALLRARREGRRSAIAEVPIPRPLPREPAPIPALGAEPIADAAVIGPIDGATAVGPPSVPAPRAAPVAPGTLPRCSVIVPVHNKSGLTRQCLDALLVLRPDDPPFEIVVVDDASDDDTPELLAAYERYARSVALPDNAGFAGACNAGAAAARGDYLVFLNNDTVPQRGWLDKLVRHADLHPEAAVVGAKLLYPDDTVQHAGVVFGAERYPHHIYAGFPEDHPAVNKTRRFRAVTAACFLARRAPFEAVGGFDRAFVNGWEDVDLCLKLGEAGHEIHYCHESVVYHLESASRNVRAERERRNRELFASRWLDRIEPDSVRYYLEDGLLWVTVLGALYPVRIEASPLLGIMGGATDAVVQVLAERAAQVDILQRTNVLLHHRLAQARARESALWARLDGAAESPAAAAAELLAGGRVHWPAEGRTDRVVSIVLVVQGDGGWVPALLPRLLGQRRGQGIELIAVADRPDGVGAAALREAGATLVAVDPGWRPTGALRNLAAAYARGVVLVFVDPAAKPADDGWLARLLAPLDLDDATAVAVAAPPDDGQPATADGAAAWRPSVLANDERETPGLTEDDRHRLLDVGFAGTAVRTDVAAEIPFPEEPSDGSARRWAERVLEAGYAIERVPSAAPRP